MNQCGRRGPHFHALLLEFASLLVKRSSDYCLLLGPFAVPPTVALYKVLNYLGARLTRVAHRKEHVAHVIRGIEALKAVAAFLYSAARRDGSVPGGREVNGVGYGMECFRAGRRVG